MILTALRRPGTWPALVGLYLWWREYGTGRRASLRLALSALEPEVHA